MIHTLFPLCAHKIANRTHHDMNDHPHVPMVIGVPISKKQKYESMSSALVNAEKFCPIHCLTSELCCCHTNTYTSNQGFRP